MEKTARPLREELKKAIFYQIFLRACTEEGTIRAAKKLLPEIADLGVSIVYLCPINEADDDMDTAHWSIRQNESGFKNPKNPYRIKDYFKIDEEYGTDEDLDGFVKEAHRLGLLVFLDLVYLHCGPRAVFLEEHPDFIARDEKGEIVYNDWRFPNLNFENAPLRAYLTENMCYFVRRFAIDGYRCDVGDGVPLDFWLAARREVEKIKPSIAMLNEGVRGEYLEQGFEWNYCFKFQTAFAAAMKGQGPAAEMRRIWEETRDAYPLGGRCIRYLDNHDTASDSYGDRYEKLLGEAGMATAFAMIYTMDGAPLLYNGNEACDDSRHSLWSNRDHGKLHVRWENALSPVGAGRRALLKNLAALRREHPCLYDGDMRFLYTDCPDHVLAYVREKGDDRIFILLHTGNARESVTVKLPGPIGRILCNSGISFHTENGKLYADLPSYGYLIFTY